MSPETGDTKKISGRKWIKILLTPPAPCISESCIEIKINSNSYFDTFLWCLKCNEGFFVGVSFLLKLLASDLQLY